MVDPDKLYADVWRMRREGRQGEALTLASDALAEARQGADAKALASALCVKGQMERDHGRVGDAVALYLEAAALYRGLNDQEGIAYAARHACDLQRELGRLSEAEALGAEGVAAYRAMKGAALDLANMLRVYGLLKEDMGERGEARALWAEAGELYAAARVQAGVDEARRRQDELR
jgi:hypothetical protein